ncbi:2-dehydropantoate 2-reductase [Pseudonocardia bannensis]|uniref:2-dehydropantoate 2-reductase n=1 Tax=Pseudonocardia bannensis TaxID=630973 RepID=A0A848DKM8_9PSEU|nr:2-dehydropantoate 2-reductase [Pseudonocardia bannensis]NMH93103.1 2-dehydropantoate 2-reductase [Pseudonocardia bannensis]
MSAPAPDAVAVVGSGAVGTTLAAALAEAGHPIVVCGGTPLDAITLTDHRGERRYPVRWAERPADLPAARWVLLATKIHQTSSVLPWLSALAGPDSHVIAAQNGVDHRDRLSPVVDGAVAPALVYINAERTGPGAARARLTERELVLPDDAAGHCVARLFDGTWVRAEIAADFRTAAWLKLLTNAVANPVTALTGRRIEVLRDPAVAELATDVLRETVAVGRAEGAVLPDECVEQTLRWLQGLQPGSTSSMLQDRLAGRALEYEGLTGVIVRLADRHGIPVPANRALLALLGALECGAG